MCNCWMKHLDNIRLMRNCEIAPVDVEGCSTLAANYTDNDVGSDKKRRFITLVSLMLSSQTKDEVTSSAVNRLHESKLLTVQSMANASTSDIALIIKPVGFYRKKAQNLRLMANHLIDEHNGDIPRTIDQLMKIPGIGPKMSYLTMQCAWNECVGIGVDTHVHRISKRLQWVKNTKKNPEHTRLELEKLLPKQYWPEINKLLVGFGQTICRPIKPKCDQCLNRKICPYSIFYDKNEIF